MPTNYLGNQANTQAPSAKPEPESNITVVLPADGDPVAASTVAQAWKACADFINFLLIRKAKAALTPAFLNRVKTAVGHTRWALDRTGLPAATTVLFQELWTNIGDVQGPLAAEFIAQHGGWRGNATHATSRVYTMMDLGGPVVVAECGDTINGFAGLWSGGMPQVGNPGTNNDIALESAIVLIDTMADVEVIFGIAQKLTSDPRGTEGLRFIKTPASANWQAVSTGPVGETVVDTGVAAVTGNYKRFRIEWRGANVNDGGADAAYFYIQGAAGSIPAHVATITTNLPAPSPSATQSIVFAAKNLTGNAMGTQKAHLRQVHLAANFNQAITA